MPSAVSQSGDFLRSALGIRPGEERRTGLLFAHLLLASAAFILGRTVRDALFLSEFPGARQYLPWMFVLYGVASALTVVVYSRFADRFPRPRLIMASCGIGALIYLGTWLLVLLDLPWIYPVFYVVSEVAANLFIVQFWTFANDLHDPRSAKRLFGTIGSGRVLGTVLVGVLSGAIVRLIGTAQLLFVLVLFMGGIIGLAAVLGRERPAEAGPRIPVRVPRASAGSSPWRDPYVRMLALFTLLGFTALTVGDFQFKMIARETWQGDALARFFSLFYAGTGLVSFFFQVVATPRILRTFGVGAGVSVMPSAFGVTSLLLLLVPNVGIATAMKFCDNGFQYTIHDTSLQALYVPFPPQAKARTRAFLDAVIKPASYGIGGLVLVAALAGQLSVQWMSAITVPLSIGWLLSVPAVKRRYLRALESTLKTRGALDLNESDPLDAAGRAAWIAALSSDDPRLLLVALDQVDEASPPEIRAAAERLAEHASADVRAAALARLRVLPGTKIDVFVARLADPDDAVRAEAFRGLGAVGQDDHVEKLAPGLADAAREVRVASRAGLLRWGGILGDMLGAPGLGNLLRSENRKERAEAAAVLGELGREAYRPIRTLLDDPHPAVRRAALRAAAGVADPRLIPALLHALDDPACTRRAGAALVAIGRDAINPLLRLATQTTTPRHARLLVPTLLKRLPHVDSLRALRELVGAKDSQLRFKTYGAISHLRAHLGLPGDPAPIVLDIVRREVIEIYRNIGEWAAARSRYDGPLVAEAFAERFERGVGRVLRALELRYDRETLRLVGRRLQDPSRRANALELLDSVLDVPFREPVMLVVDDSSEEGRVTRAGAIAGSLDSPASFMRRQCEHANPYVAALALISVARAGDDFCGKVGADASHHRDPFVREASAYALAAASGGSASERLRELCGDPDPAVSRAAELALREPSTLLQGGSMYSTAEKILLLKKAPLFGKLSGEELLPIARAAEEESFPSGHFIFRTGDAGDAFYVVVRGEVAIERPGGGTISRLGPGGAFGEMAVLDSAPRSADARVSEEAEVLRIGSEEFFEAVHDNVELAEGIIRLLSSRLREALARNAATEGPAVSGAASRAPDADPSHAPSGT